MCSIATRGLLQMHTPSTNINAHVSDTLGSAVIETFVWVESSASEFIRIKN